MLGILLAELGQPIPRVFLEEPHGGVERGAAPHLDREDPGAEPGVGVGHAEHVAGPDPGRQQRLVGVAEGRVGQEQRLLLADPAGERLGAQLPGTAVASPGGGSTSGSNAGGAGSACARVAGAAGVTPGKPLTVTSAA